MHFMYTVASVACVFLINLKLLKSEDGIPDDTQKSPEEIDDSPIEDEIIREGHSFVALIDVVFKDASKRSCTGAIIHDHVIVTAAHCFVHELDENVQPEITASFVIIGTKKMFVSGYEQYLPIERILTHPKYDGWSADICLVYTFAGMTSDKPGKIIKLSGEKTLNQAESNVTVLTWRTPKEEETVEEVRPTKKSTPSCDDTSDEKPVKKGKHVSEENQHSGQERHIGTQMINWYARGHTAATVSTKKRKEFVPGGLFYKYPVLQQKMQLQPSDDHPLQWKSFGDSKKMSRYLTSNEGSEQQEDDGIAVILMSPDTDKQQILNVTIAPPIADIEATAPRYPLRTIQTARRRQPRFKGWRRVIAKLENQLNVERYTLVSTSNCKKILENALAPRFTFNNGEAACYTSEENILTDEDSGAPVVRRSRLVALTIGGAESDGDHVGVGLRISCYCQWIADNIPGGNSIKCCRNCCDVKHTEHYVQTTSKKRRKNKYLLK